jgi:hypothetical protein
MLRSLSRSVRRASWVAVSSVMSLKDSTIPIGSPLELKNGLAVSWQFSSVPSRRFFLMR